MMQSVWHSFPRPSYLHDFPPYNPTSLTSMPTPFYSRAWNLTFGVHFKV